MSDYDFEKPVCLLIRKDTTANWQAVNPTLANGELGIEVKPDGGESVKVGTGSATWNNLPYTVNSPTPIFLMIKSEFVRISCDIPKTMPDGVTARRNENIAPGFTSSPALCR